MKYYNLKEDKYIYLEDNNAGLKFLYENIIGRIILKIMISKPIRCIYNAYSNSILSKHKIKRFIKKNNIDMKRYEEKEYVSFNDFFKRKIKREHLKVENGLFAIADSKLSIYKIDDNSCFKIKNSFYTVSELVGEDIDYRDGYALIFRLCVDDYHRYLFVDDGVITKTKIIPGILHTVQPIALKKHKVFSENQREVTFMNTKKYGEVISVEVGAMMIGKIVNKDLKKFKRGEEKGHFEFGGSTIVLLFKKDTINPKEILLKNTEDEIENIVKIGENLENDK